MGRTAAASKSLTSAITRCLKELGEDAEQVAGNLFTNGCFGNHGLKTCPIATYLSSRFDGRRFGVTMQGIRLYDPCGWLIDKVQTTKAVADFIHRYDDCKEFSELYCVHPSDCTCLLT